MCKPEYCKPVAETLEIVRVVAGRASSVKNTLWYMAGLTLALICMAAAGLLWSYSEKRE